MNDASHPTTRLTQLAHGGGCGCKIAPSVLRDILATAPKGIVPEALLVGVETSDDAAVYRIDGERAIVATTDFFTPIVDDPFDFGAIAAANALSDVYAMGGTPLLALALVGMPVGKVALDAIRRVLDGGESVCARAGIPIAGGHTIDSIEPIYGLVAIGLVDPRHVKRNGGARPGDALILGKPLGIGVYGAAIRKERLARERYAAMIAATTQLNTPGIALGALDAVHAMTDVTGFGLLGHLLEMCRASSCGATVDYARLPLHPGVTELAREGFVTGASARNWSSYGTDVDLDTGVGDIERAILTDPQTSGGLLAACAPNIVEQVLALLRRDGFARAAVVGEVIEGPARVAVRSGA